MTSLAAAYSPTPFPTEYKPAIKSSSQPAGKTVNFDIQEAQKNYAYNQLHLLRNLLDEIKEWPNNWDSYGAKKPKSKSVESAKRFIYLALFGVHLGPYEWMQPNITADSDGEIVFEWWKNDKKLTVYVSGNEMAYIKVPSPEIDEMEDGVLNFSLEELRSLWEWLTY